MTDTIPLPDGAAVRWGQRLAVLLAAALLWGGLTTAPTFAQAELQIIHNSPDPRASTVDVYVDNESNPTVDDLSFRGATDYLSLPVEGNEQQFEIDIAPGDSEGPDEAVATQTVTLQDGEDFVAIATGELGLNGTGDGNFQLVLKAPARKNVSDTDGDVELFGAHGSPDAPTVDVQTNDGSTTLLDEIAFPEIQPASGNGYASIAPGTYTLDVNVSGSGATAATFEADLSGFGDQTATVLASGYLTPDDEPFSSTPDGFGLIAALSNGTVVSFTPVTRAQIIHNSPDPNAETVDIYADGDLLVDNLSFRNATGYVNVPSGEREIAVAPPNSNTPNGNGAGDALYTQTVTFTTGATYSVIASGELNNDFQLLAKTDAREFAASEDGNVEFFGVHGSPDAPDVDVQTNDRSATLLSGLSYPGIQPTSGNGYNSVAPGTYTLDVNVAGSGNTAATFEADLSGLGDQTATVLASGYLTPGDEGFETTPDGFGLIAALSDGTVVTFTPVARAQIIHNSGDPAAKAVDIYVDNESEPFLEDVRYRDATGFVNVPAGDREIDVAPAGSSGPGDAVATQTVTFETGETYSVLANGVLNSADFEGDSSIEFALTKSADARERVASEDGDVEIRAAHGATDAPTVDIQDGNDNTLFDNASYPGITGYAGAPASSVTLKVTPGTDSNNDALFRFDADLSGFADTPLTVVASGFASPDNENTDDSAPVAPFTLIAVTPGGDVVDLGAARAQIIHNSGDPAAKVVDIYVDGERALDDFEYRSATPFINLDSGVRDIAVAPGNSQSVGDAIATFTEVVPRNGSVSIIANGVLNPGSFQDNPDGVNKAFDLDVATGARETADSEDGDVEIRAAHGVTDAPTVDVEANNALLVDDATFRQITGYVGAPAGEATLDVTSSDGSTTLYTYEVDLGPFADTPLTVLASGFNTTDGDDSASPLAPFTLLAVAPDGTVINLGSDVVVNEFLADPNGSVDANEDGTAGSGDQFVELFNTSTTDAVDLTGYTISTSNGTYTVPDEVGTTLDPRTGLVVFAGGSPGDFAVFAGTGLPSIDLSGDEIVLADADGGTLQTVQFGGGSSANSKSTLETGVPVRSGESTARDPNGTGDFVLHTNINGENETAGEVNTSAGEPLPVELADFSAQLDEEAAVLTWRTLSEQNNSGFEVQHRVGEDGAFEKVGFREGQGTTSEATSYRFRVEDLQAGTHAFRLRQVDLDGSGSMSDVVRVEVTLDEAFAWTKVAPNPVSSTGTLSMQVRESQDVTVELYDLLGRRVRMVHSGTLPSGSRHQVSFKAGDLANGTYLLRADGEEFSKTQRITVVK